MALRNPILPGFNPDPSILRVGQDYFLTTSTFEYFPGLPIYTSRDLVCWRLIGHALNRPSQLNMRTVEPGGGIYAPTLRMIRGRVYVAVACVYRRQHDSGPEGAVPPRGFCVSTDDIWDETRWSDPTLFDCVGIDQDLFHDQVTDQVFLSTTISVSHPPGHHSAVQICEVDLSSGRCLTRPITIRSTDIGNGYTEGSHIFKRGEYYYLLTAEGGTEVEHQEWVGRSKGGPYGPWEVGPTGVNPLVYNGEHAEVRQTGHMDMIQGSDGDWWAVFLAVRPQLGGHDKLLLSQLGRETFLAPVQWEDGWPVVNRRQPVTINGPHCGLDRVDAAIQQKFDFHPDKPLHPSWYHLRTPLKREYDLTLRPGYLALWGGPYSLVQDECPTMILQKQSAFRGVWTSDLEFDPETASHEAGVTVWWSKYAFATIGIRQSRASPTSQFQGGSGKANDREIVFRSPDPTSDEFIVTTRPLEPGMVHLEVRADTTSYTFSSSHAPIGSAASASTIMGSLSTSALVRTRAFDSIFTGTHIGLFVTSEDGTPCLEPAVFSGVSWTAEREGGV